MKKIILLLLLLCWMCSALLAQCPDHNVLSNKIGSQIVMNWKPTAAGEKEALKYAATISHISLVSEKTGVLITSQMTLRAANHKGVSLKRRLFSEVKEQKTFKRPFSGTVTLHMKDGTSCSCEYKENNFVSKSNNAKTGG